MNGVKNSNANIITFCAFSLYQCHGLLLNLHNSFLKTCYGESEFVIGYPGSVIWHIGKVIEKITKPKN